MSLKNKTFKTNSSNRVSYNLYLTDAQREDIKEACEHYKMKTTRLIFYVFRKIGIKGLKYLIRINRASLSGYHGNSQKYGLATSSMHWVYIKDRPLFFELKELARVEQVSISSLCKLLLHQAVLVVEKRKQSEQ